ncbi:Involucrin repeat protein [Pleurostoma richardsiae]|uniref:Involucrin repeat protein n=1 Tax=Pleurostoma richardsiae TaxID=41990 RepID=A0AA38VMP7_9PEZI|nr:Involucrin repeat protein [Pleurostoma richardsiae]
MSSPDKRRGAGNPTGQSHALRPANTGSSGASNSNNSSSSNNPRHNANSAVISPPPRAALTGPSSSSSSPSPDDRTATGASSSSSTPAPSRRDSSATSTAAAAVAAAAAATQLVREKDQRIASLERELSVMEDEFARELGRLSRAESETATFWQAKHSALHQQFLRADTELRLARAEADARAAERGELLAGLDAARREARAREEEARGLRAQVRGLKEWVSTSTRAAGGQQASDEVFGEGMARLGNGLQNWVIVNFRKAKFDISRADEETVRELSDLVPMHEELAQTAKVHLLQSIVSRILVDMVFDAYFVGLSPEEADQLTQVENLLVSFAGATEAVNQWRSLTLTTLKKEAAEKMQTQTSRAVEDVVARVNRLLGAVTDARPAEARDQALRALVHGAVDLSRMLAVQKAVFEVSMPEVLPHQSVVFDHATMEDIGGEDEEGLVQREICCVAFPGIIKRGDENGGHLQFRNVIAKARVLCAPE